MMKYRWVSMRRLMALGILSLMLSACAGAGGVKVALKQDQYTPGFKGAEFGRYKGKKVTLASFTNQAANTKQWNFFSPDKTLTYETSAPLESYIWSCYQKAFQQIGVRLVDYAYEGPRYYRHHYWGAAPQAAAQAARGVTEFQMVLTSLTDQEFKFQVSLFKDGENRFQKDFAVTMEPSQTQDSQELARRAHRMVDLSFTTIMKDRDFQKAF